MYTPECPYLICIQPEFVPIHLKTKENKVQITNRKNTACNNLCTSGYHIHLLHERRFIDKYMKVISLLDTIVVSQPLFMSLF